MDINAMAKRLCRLDYRTLDAELSNVDDATLMDLLDSGSMKVVNAVAPILNRRDKADLVADAILASRFSTKLGRIASSSILRVRGKHAPRCAEVYLKLLEDKTADVVNEGLFGLVFLQDLANIPKIVEARKRSRAGPKADGYFEKALQALEARDPFIFDPYFCDAVGVWELEKARFGRRAGSRTAAGAKGKQETAH